MAEFKGVCGNCGRKVSLISLEPIDNFDASEFCCGVSEKAPEIVTEPEPVSLTKAEKKAAKVAEPEPVAIEDVVIPDVKLDTVEFEAE